MLVTANILQPLLDVLEPVLKFFHNDVGVGWGLSIVLLTVVVRAALIPLTVKQFKGMQQMQAHAPELKAIKERYKDDKARQQEEMMKFYKENNVNPLGSCLPLLLQMPIFFALFFLLRKDLLRNICPEVLKAHPHAHACAVAHHAAPQAAHFLFIPDLTSKATGAVLVVLMVLYVGTQLFASVMMMAKGVDPNQRRLMLVLPLLMMFFFISFPAGLLVYWITTNLFQIVQQLIVKRIVGPPPVPVTTMADTKPGSGRKRALDPAPAPEQQSFGSMLRRRLDPSSAPEPATAPPSRNGVSAGPPPPPPRKKKKRSGRRR